MQTAKAKRMQFCNLFSRKKHHGLQEDEARVTLEYCSSQQDTRMQSSRQRGRGKGFGDKYSIICTQEVKRKEKDWVL